MRIISGQTDPDLVKALVTVDRRGDRTILYFNQSKRGVIAMAGVALRPDETLLKQFDSHPDQVTNIISNGEIILSAYPSWSALQSVSAGVVMINNLFGHDKGLHKKTIPNLESIQGELSIAAPVQLDKLKTVTKGVTADVDCLLPSLENVGGDFRSFGGKMEAPRLTLIDGNLTLRLDMVLPSLIGVRENMITSSFMRVCTADELALAIPPRLTVIGGKMTAEFGSARSRVLFDVGNAEFEKRYQAALRHYTALDEALQSAFEHFIDGDEAPSDAGLSL